MKQFLWVAPFLAFVAGYQLINFLTSTNEFGTPSLVGLPIGQAVKILSNHNLNVRILSEKDEWDLAPGTVLSQVPRANNKIKQQQPVFLVIAKKPRKQVPDLRNKPLAEVQALADLADLRLKTYFLPLPYPAQTCVGQFPSPGQYAEQNKIIAYISSGEQKPCIFPDVRNLSIGEVTEWLKPYPARISIVHNRPITMDHFCDHCIIIEQKPLPGAIITVDKEFIVRLEVN